MAVIYCGQCGQPAAAREFFCVACGTRLRRPDGNVAEEGAGLSAEVVEAVLADDRIALRHALGLLARREHGAAVRVLERLCAERPQWAVARAYLGIAYLRATRIAEARWELEEAARQAPASFICRAKLGEFLARLGFYDQGMEELDIALALAAPDSESRHAAMELRQFCKDKSKGIFYRKTAYPNIGRLMPRRRSHAAQTVQLERGS